MSAIQFTDRGAAVRVSGAGAVLARAALTARKAPSMLTGQPWRWRVAGPVLELRADHACRAAGPDPDARLLTMSCGAALHHARIALAAEGARTTVDYLPDPTEPDLLATITYLGAGLAPDPAALRAYRAITTRHSDSRRYASEPVPDAAVDPLRAAARQAGANLHVMAGDGGTRLAVIVTMDDGPRDWLAAGAAWSAVLLAATAEGLATSRAEIPGAPGLLRRAIPAGAHPMIGVRIGLPPAP